MSVSSTPNPAGGQDINVVVSKELELNSSCNAIVGLTAGGNSQGGSAHAGLFTNLNANGLGVSLSKTIFPGAATRTELGVNANLLENDSHSVNAHAFTKKTELYNGPVSKTHGFSLDYNNANGQGVSFSETIVPGIETITTLSAKTNLFKNDSYKVDAHAFTNKKNLNSGPALENHGFGVDYKNVLGHGALVGISKTPGVGTFVDVGATTNIFQSKKSSLDLMANAKIQLDGDHKEKYNLGVVYRF